MFNKRKKLLADYKATFESHSGKNVLKDLMKAGHILSSCFDPNDLEMARMEGERNVVLRILSLLDTDIEKAEKYFQEAIGDNDGDE